MDLERTPARISYMSAPAWRKLSATLLAAALLVTVAAARTEPASAAVGVEKVSRLTGAPGDSVHLTLACGFCFPPCDGASGHQSGSCMPGKAEPPEAFPVSLVPIGKAPKLHRCGPNAVCPPQPRGAPRRDPYVYLGRAAPPADGSNSDGRNVPRYLLDFDIPDLRPGIYTYVVFCDVCARGTRGSLIANPASRLWQLRVLTPAAG